MEIIMWIIGIILIYLAIKKKMEPALLLPLGFGTILINLPGDTTEKVITHLFDIGIAEYELLPLLLFVGLGTMIDFTFLLQNPKFAVFGLCAQAGILATMGLAFLIGFPIQEAASIGIIGAADGPTAIFVAQILESQYLAAIMVAAYSYMALIPIIQPPVIKLLTTKKERQIKMALPQKIISKKVKIILENFIQMLKLKSKGINLFFTDIPIATTIVVSLIAPESAILIGFLMFGNLIKECGVLDSLKETAQTTLTNLITIFLGLIIASQMRAEYFLQINTLIIIALGLVAFIFDTAGGVIAAKVINLFSKNKINPMIGACGISAFPISAKVVQQMGVKEDPNNHLIMYAVAANVSGQIFSVLISGIIIALCN